MTRSVKCVLTLVTAVAGAVLSLRRRRAATPSTEPVPAPPESVEVVTPADAEENGAPIADETVLAAVELVTPVDPEDSGSHVAMPTATGTAAAPRTRRTARPQTTKDRVLSALSSEVGLTAGEVSAATGIARGTVSTTLSNLVRAGEIVKAPRGYRLPA